MAGALREQALPLLAAANKHGDLAVKISSLKQARGILLSAEPSLAAELFPYLIELQSSPEVLVRKHLIEVIEEIGMKAMRNSSMLMPVLLTFLKDNDSNVAMQSIISGTNIFCSVLEELSLQFRRHGIVESWLEELWSWMIKFKDAVFGILYEAASVGTKLLGIKFLETYILLFTPDASNSEKPFMEDVTRNAGSFNISRLVGGHPILDPVELVSEANRAICFLLDLLQLRYKLPGCVTISVVNSLAAIARRRPVHYSSLLSTLLELDLSFETSSRVHTPSIQYALRTAFLGFLRCTHPVIVESRERLLRALRAMNAGDASDQVLRQVDKLMRSNGRASRDARVSKDEHPSSHLPVSGDPVKKRLMPLDNNEEPTNAYDIASKKICYASNTFGAPPVQLIDSGHDYPSNGVSPKVPLLNSDLTPVEQMIAMIGALIAEGERGVESLKILISKIQPDLLADIVMTNMKHLPKYSPPSTRLSSPPITQQSDSSTGLAQVVSPFGSAPAQTPVPTAHVLVSPSNATSLSADTPASINLPADSKRDPRRDPRRLDPRRVSTTSVLVPSTPAEDSGSATQSGNMPPEFDASNFPNASISEAMVTGIDDTSSHLMSKSETDPNILGSPVFSRVDQLTAVEELQDEAAKAVSPDSVVNAGPRTPFSTSNYLHEDLPQKSADPAVTDEASSSSSLEADEPSSSVSNTAVSEESCLDLPVLPLYVELKEEQERDVRKLAVGRIIDSYRHLQGTDCKQTRMILLARLVAQIDTDDNMVVMMQKHVVSDYQQQQGHELVMHVLYHLHTLMSSDSLERSSFAAGVYEKFLLVMAKSLLDALPATDKSFSRLLGEAPSLPDSIFKLLDDICSFGNHHGKAVRDGDRITQGLGAVWSLILGRPLNRQACLDIALKCAVNPQDDVRAKAIRLVANKLYVLDYSSAYIEEYSIKRFLSAVDMHVSDVENSQSDATEHRTEGEMGSQETSISGSQFSEPGVSGNVSLKGTQDDPQSDSPLSFAQAQRLISLFFALCTKKSSLLQLAFDNYARAPKAVKQAIHRHVPILMRALESSYAELHRMIADPPDGCENLLTQVLHILSEGSTPSSDLVATVKRLYETKLKDATILIPVLSSFSKNEVLPIIPRLVDLPLDKFQTALAHILQGSAHTGPALTPTEVLVAIHDIRPEKDGVALKKITDACSACFEQRMVFTQQVLSKALNQMVNQTPLPLLFMRTVIQAIDAHPSLVNFVMEILSKLVNRQVWRMPKLWVGFLKCVYQTQPHSFHVLLQLPSAQLDSVLNRYANLRDPLAAYANQPSVRSLLPRSTQVLLGLSKESHPQQPHPPSLHAPDTNSSVHGTTLT